jgi:hypothetical protein
MKDQIKREIKKVMNARFDLVPYHQTHFIMTIQTKKLNPLKSGIYSWEGKKEGIYLHILPAFVGLTDNVENPMKRDFVWCGEKRMFIP